MTFATGYNSEDREEMSLATGLKCTEDEDCAQQHFREECDINTIVERFGLTGTMPTNLKMPMAGDFTNIPSYEEALRLVTHANQQFHTLPAELRSRFGHNPGNLIEFLEDPGNRDEAEKLGLVRPKPATIPTPESPGAKNEGST